MRNLIPENERRASTDRRKFCYAAYVPERRSGAERRSEIEKWSGAEEWSGIEKRLKVDGMESKVNNKNFKVM